VANRGVSAWGDAGPGPGERGRAAEKGRAAENGRAVAKGLVAD